VTVFMVARVVRTLDDLALAPDAMLGRPTLWLLPSQEPRRQRIEQMLGMLSVPGHDRDAPDAQACMAGHGIGPAEVALDCLRAWELQLFMILSIGRCQIPGRRGGLRFAVPSVVHLIVAPDPCYFRPELPDRSGPVHRLGASCLAGHAAIVNRHARAKAFSIWNGLDDLTVAFERRVPWCPECED
jgi:hypothetical protein